jgi:hypothetical protein
VESIREEEFEARLVAEDPRWKGFFKFNNIDDDDMSPWPRFDERGNLKPYAEPYNPLGRS